MTTDRWLAIAAVVAFLGGVYLAGWAHYRCPRWRIGCTCTDLDLPGPDSLPAPRAGGYLYNPVANAIAARIPLARLDADVWDDGWQREPWTDADADQLIAEWRDEPPLPAGLPRDTFGAWWAGLDGLERECMLVHDLMIREAREWAEIKAETREMCAA